MATSRDFGNMLNEYLTVDLMTTEYKKRDWLLQNVTMDKDSKGGQIPVPFVGSHASSVEFGQLAAESDIAKMTTVRGNISSFAEVWGTMRWEHRDIIEQDGKVNEKSFLKLLPGQLNDFLDYVKMCVAINALNGSHFATATANGTVGGVLAVDRIDRFTIGQKLVLDDNDSAPVTVYVIAISIDAKTVTVSATRGGAALDISAYTLAQVTRCFHPGAQAGSFTSIKSQLLSLANGGSTNLFGVAKTAWPFLQCPNVSGSAISAANILTKLFEAYTTRQILARGGELPKFIMSYKHFGSILALLETQKGGFNIVPGSRKVSQYGYQTVSIGSVTGELLEIVAVLEMDDDYIAALDLKTIKFFSNGMFMDRVAPDGKKYYEIRGVSGYSYIYDVCMFGEIAVLAPYRNLIIHSIPNY